jgi:hypothetical protein
MAGWAFQIFLRRAVAALHGIALLLLNVPTMPEIPGINWALRGQILVIRRQLPRQA